MSRHLPRRERARALAENMQRPFTGFAWTLAVLFAIGVIGGFCTDGFSDFGDTPLEGMTLTLPYAVIFDLVVLFAIVWPTTLLTGWLVRRFHVARVVPFAFFFVTAGIVVAICSDHKANSLLNYLMAFASLFVPCATLWCISFRHEARG
jgi:hypothetical protein